MNSKEPENIPPTEPTSASTAVADPWATESGPEAITHIDGAALVPDLSSQSVRSMEYWYWVGVTADCPTSFLTCGGINFPKAQEIVTPDPTQNGRQLRQPVFGSLQKLNEEQMQLLIKHLPRRVLRFVNEKNADGSRKGYGVRIPSVQDIEDRRKNNRPLRKYVAQKDDEPAARYMFAVICPNQDTPTRGNYYPPSLEEVGIKWPDELESTP